VTASADRPRIILATAHPAKFREVVEPVLGRDVPLPPSLAARLAHAPQSTRIAPALGALADTLAGLG
jgi:threonine synthase